MDAEFGLQIYTCMLSQHLARKPWRKPLATISTKGCIDTARVYQPGFAGYITLGGAMDRALLEIHKQDDRNESNRQNTGITSKPFPEGTDMNASIANPHNGMISFQQCLRAGKLELSRVPNHQGLFSHFDVPAPGVHRLTYARLSEDQKTVKAFLSCIMNGEVDGFPCVAVGYAVPEDGLNQGRAKQILRDVINDQILQARSNGIETIFIEAVVDVTNLPSQRVAEAVLSVERESITDSASGRPAYRYTARFNGTP